MTNYEKVLSEIDKSSITEYLSNKDNFCCGTYTDGNGCCATEMQCGECIAEWLEREAELPFSSLEESAEELA